MEKKYNFYDKNLIGHIEIRNLDCFYFTRYYPVNKYGYNENQEFIFDFKEGVSPFGKYITNPSKKIRFTIGKEFREMLK